MNSIILPLRISGDVIHGIQDSRNNLGAPWVCLAVDATRCDGHSSRYLAAFEREIDFDDPPATKFEKICQLSTPITLDQFLKQAGVVGSGGQAKILIQAGDVSLNGTVETRRGKKLAPGDIVEVLGERLIVQVQ